MPTQHDETLQERYSREQEDYLSILAGMTPEQIQSLEIELHNALAERDRLLAIMSQVKECIGPYLYGGSNFRDPARQAVALIDAAIQGDQP